MAKKDETTEPNISDKAAAVVSALTPEMFMAGLKEILANKQSDPAMMAIAESLKDQADIAKQRRREENAVNPRISAFSNPEGEEANPKPRLDSVTIFANALQQEDQLTPYEITLFNRIKSNKTARKGKWTAIYEPPIGDAKQGRLTISLGANLNSPDAVTDIPPLVQILTELGTGKDATDVAKLFEKMAAMELELASLKQSQAAETVNA